MEKRKLGRQGLEVSTLGLGCMGMSWAYGARDDAESIATIHAALDAGVDFFDTAEIYGPYDNERLLARALGARRHEVVIASKFGFRIGATGKIEGIDGSPANVRRACEASLERLGTDYIDLFYQHRVDVNVPIEETVGAMADLVREGKVRYLGLSEAGPGTLAKAHAVHPISALQSEYSLWERNVEDTVLPACRALGIGFVPYSPLGRGFLTGSIRSSSDIADPLDMRTQHPRFDGENLERNLRLARALEAMAARLGVTAAQLALGWLLRQGKDIVPIPGTKKRRWLAENLGAATLDIRTCDLFQLEEMFPRGAAVGERYTEAGMKTIDRR
ncbi:MAG: aldo/keto reductase [Steroidobacteraceae bacterium]|nr:aldo/keto reductase [Steroidobacteraceae bacterium]